MDKRQDLILLVLDTQRADRLSCYGYPKETCPALNGLAVEATIWVQAAAPAQWTVPAHASMFTGLYPSQHQLVQMNSVLAPELSTLAERLQQGGYYTAGFSHNPLVGVVNNGLARGFHQLANYNYLGAGLLTFHLNQDNSQRRLGRWLWQKSRFLLAELLGYSNLTAAHRLSPLLLPFWQMALHLRSKSKVDCTWASLEAAAQLLIKRGKSDPGQPVFTFINLMGTHVPYAPSRTAIKRCLSDAVGHRSAESWLQQSNNVQVNVDNWLEMAPLSDEDKVILSAFYDAEVLTQDTLIDQFITQLRAAGVLDNAMLIIVADHGDHLGEKKRLNHVFGVYQQLIHVPLIIRFPGGSEGRGHQVSIPVSTRRVFHTIVSAAGLATPDEQVLSLTNQVVEEVLAEGYPLQWAISRINERRPGIVARCQYDQPVRALYANSRKFIQTGDRAELYDLLSDPSEEKNLAGEERTTIDTLRFRLDQMMQTVQPAGVSGLNVEEDTAILEHLRSLGYVE
jgi:arylsulfatase A-like enzyme